MPTTETHNISIHIKKAASLFVMMKVRKPGLSVQDLWMGSFSEIRLATPEGK